jgi:hypothetical protein
MRNGILLELHRWIGAPHPQSAVFDWFQQPILEARPEDAYMAEYPYFRCVPMMAGSVVPGAQPVTWTNWCFRNNSAVVKDITATTMTLEFHVGDARSLLCTDSYMFVTTSSVKLHTFLTSGRHLVTFSLSKGVADRFDVDHSGVRIGQFVVSPLNILKALEATVSLFVPAILKPEIPEHVAATNLDFLAKYRGLYMEPLSTPPVVPNEAEVQSGDMFGGIRLDGLDTMLAWAMGSSTGHTAVAVRVDGELYVSESTTKDGYWPTDGIQKTPWKQWIAQVQKADYHWVWLPLKPEVRAHFNGSAAAAVLAQHLGTPYGTQNMLWSWIDTAADNYPCVPPNFDKCLDPRLVMPLFGFVDHLTKGLVGGLMWTQAFNKRLGTVNLTTAETFMEATKRKMQFSDLTAIPEKDDWKYSSGISRMCDAWVCTVWKEAGIFGDLRDQFQCTESTNWDILTLPLFSKQQQISGKYRMYIHELGSKMWAPYPQYAEACGGHAPKWDRTRNC